MRGEFPSAVLEVPVNNVFDAFGFHKQGGGDGGTNVLRNSCALRTGFAKVMHLCSRLITALGGIPAIEVNHETQPSRHPPGSSVT